MEVPHGSRFWQASGGTVTTRHIALGLSIASVALLDVANAWVSKQRNNVAATITPLETAAVMLESQWGRPYFSLPLSKGADGSLEFDFFRAVTGEAGGSGGSSGGSGESEGGHGEEENKASWESPDGCVGGGLNLNKAEAKVFHTVVKVEDAATCQKACSNDARCRSAVYGAEGGTCELVRLVKKLVSDKSSTVVLPNCDSSCFKKGEKLTGSGKDSGVTPNPQLCQALCHSDSSCKAFSWSGSDNKCTLHGEDRSTAEDSRSVWGPSDSCTPNSKAFDYAGSCEEEALSGSPRANLRTLRTDDNEKCREACYKEEKCQWVTYNRSTRYCYLKDGRRNVSHVVDADVTYPKLCDSSCFRKDSALVGTTVAVVEDMRSPHYCHYECWMNVDCSFWHWEGGSSKKCNLYGVAAGLISEFAEGHWSGSRGGCGKEAAYMGEPDQAGGGIIKYAKSLADWYLTISSVKSLEECLGWCENELRCTFFGYDVEEQNCQLSEFSDVIKGSEAAVYIGTKSPSTKCFKEDFKLGGETLLANQRRTTETAALCQAECQQNSSCGAFVWDESDHSCVFKKESSWPKGEAASGFVSGPREECYKRDIAARPYSYYYPSDPGGGCSHKGVASSVAPFSTFTANDVPPCLKSCNSYFPQCEVYSWNRNNGKCTLHRNIGDGPVAGSSELYTGPVLCNSGCFYKNHQFGGTPMEAKLKNATPHDCQLKCRVLDGCNAWTYKSGTKECSFYRAGESLSLKPAADTWSGWWTFCIQPDGITQTDGCTNVLITTTGVSDMKIFGNISSVGECRAICRRTDGCVAMTYNEGSRRCYLKDRITTFIDRTYEFGDRTAAKECRGDCFLKDVRFSGPLADKEVPKPYSAQLCQAICISRKDKCAVWSYETSSGTCELRSGDALAAKVLRSKDGGSGWISGPNHFCY